MKESLDRLNTLINNERSPDTGAYSLDNMKQLLGHFGNPQERLAVVHVAGTNGKGSVCHMLHAVLTSSGMTPGLYTSPHLESVRERIIAGNTQISEAAFRLYTTELFSLLGERQDLRPTYFDALTLIALRHFADTGVDVAILETGLGGSLDSTNAAGSIISVITGIAIDHSRILGETLPEITAEKAGIIKPGSTVITSNTDPEVLSVIERHARAAGSELLVYGKDFQAGDITTDTGEGLSLTCTIRAPGPVTIETITLKSPVRAQAQNASLAAAAAMVLRGRGFPVTPDSVRDGLRDSEIPGRFQVLQDEPRIIFDPAHNPDAMEELVRTMKEQYPGKKCIAVLSVMQDKEYIRMVNILRDTLKARMVYHELNDPRAVSGNEILRAAGDMELSDSAERLAGIFRSAHPKDHVIIVTGTFRLYSDAKRAVKQLAEYAAAPGPGH